MNTAAVITALSMGFLGSLHCAGMCGPIMLILPFGQLNGWRKAAGIGVYHSGRISSYAFMGLVLHSFSAFFHPGWQQLVSVALGVLLLCAGLLSFLSGTKQHIRLPWMDFVRRQTGRLLGRAGLPALFASGMLNGLLPCGLVYMALSLAVAADTGLAAAGTMYLFGIGTLPMLLAITLLRGRVRMPGTGSLRRFVPALLFTFGALFLLRGLDLGIPYLSPQLAIKGKEVKSSCCQHKLPEGPRQR